MPIKYKIDVLEALKAAGYSTYKLRKDKLIGEATIQRLRGGEPVSWENIATLCALLDCQPGDLLEYQPGEGEKGRGQLKRGKPEKYPDKIKRLLY